jgi:hypothetical protein
VSRPAALLAAIALGLSTPAAAGDWTWGAELASGYDSNVGNAAHHRDVFDSGIAYAGVGSGWEQRFGSYTALQIGGSASAEQYSNMSQLSNLGGQLRLRLLHKPGRGFFTPVLGAWVAAGARDYGSSIRDSTDTRAGVSAALPVTTQVQVRAEAQWTDRESSGRVFDLGYASYALNADWAVAPGVTVYGAMRFNEGQYAVTAFGENEIQPKTEHLYLEPRADRIELDDAFADDWWAFRIDSQTWIGTVGVNLPLSPMMALDAQLQRSESGMGKFTYERWLASVGLLLRW